MRHNEEGAKDRRPELRANSPVTLRLLQSPHYFPASSEHRLVPNVRNGINGRIVAFTLLPSQGSSSVDTHRVPRLVAAIQPRVKANMTSPGASPKASVMRSTRNRLRSHHLKFLTPKCCIADHTGWHEVGSSMIHPYCFLRYRVRYT